MRTSSWFRPTRGLLLAGLALVLVVAAAMPGDAGTAHRPPQPILRSEPPAHGDSRPRRPARVVATLPSVAGAKYLYAEDGTIPDGIDVFSVSGTSLTFLQNVPAGIANGTYFGSHHLLVAKATKARGACLVFSSDGDSTIYSYAIKTTGKLTTPGFSTVVSGSYPQDLLLLSGKVIVTDPNNAVFDALALKADCSTKFLRSSTMNGESDATVSALSNTEIFSTDTDTGSLVTYSLATNGALTEISNVGSFVGVTDTQAVQVANTPHGTVTNVFVGQAVAAPPQTQALQYGVGAFKGSPATDGDASSSGGMGLSIKGNLLMELNNFSAQVSFYPFSDGKPGTPGFFAYLGNTALTADPTEAAVTGSTLFVAMFDAGVVDACSIEVTSVSDCTAVAMLTSGPLGSAGSVATL